MAGILIIAHAPLASALRECVSHIYGGLPVHIGAIDVLPGQDPVTVRVQAEAEIERLHEANGTVVLTDVLGATPGNIAQSLANDQVKVLAGVNLPMFVRTVCYRALPLDRVCEKALQGGVAGMQTVDSSTPVNPCALSGKAASLLPSCGAHGPH